MPHRSDSRLEALRGQGFTGATNDMLLQWLQANGASSNALPDAWREAAIAQGYPEAEYQFNDAWFSILEGYGYTGALPDKWKQFWEAGGTFNPVGAPLNFTSTYNNPNVDLSWDDNGNNANPATSYLITRSGQPDVPISAPTTNYTDNRDINPGERIVWFINLTTIDGTSNNTSTSETIPVVAFTFSADLITTAIPEIGTAGMFARGSGAYQTDHNSLLNSVAASVPRHMGARLDPDGVTYYDTQDDGTTPIDPATLLGVLIEEAGTDLFVWSEDFNQTAWVHAGIASVATDSIDSPDGALTMDKIIPTVANEASYVTQAQPLTIGEDYSITIYAKEAEYRYIQFTGASGGIGTAYYNVDLRDGALTVSDAGNSDILSVNTEIMGDGSVKFQLSFTALTTAAGNLYVICIDSPIAARFASISGDGTSGVYLWGSGYENGAYPTSYIFSDADTGSRALESLPYPVAGNLPANDVEITFEFTAFVDGLTDVILFESAVDASNYVRIRMDGSDLVFEKNVTGTPIIAKVLHTIAANTTYSIVAIQDSASGMSLAIDSGTAGTNVDTANMPLGTDFYLGGTTAQSNGCFKLVRIKPI